MIYDENVTRALQIAPVVHETYKAFIQGGIDAGLEYGPLGECLRIGDIRTVVLRKEKFSRMSRDFFDDNLERRGFCLREGDLSFVREGNILDVISTAHHEIGHLVNHGLPRSVDEEAKAYSFEFLCADLMAEKDIAAMGTELKDYLSRRNAPDQIKHPDHFRAWHYVKRQIRDGRDLRELFRGLSSGKEKVSKTSLKSFQEL